MAGDVRYSLARYSVNRADKTLAVAECFSEAMGAMAGVAVPVDIRDRFAGAVQGRAQGTVSVVFGAAFLDRLGGVAQMSANVLARTAWGEVLQTSAYGQKNIPVRLDAGEGLGSITWASKDTPTGLGLAEGLGCCAAGSKDITAAFGGSEAFMTLLEATLQTTERTAFLLTIPPGGELRVDSGLFTVLLDGENALHAQSGDWIDVSRDLLRVTVESASGGGLEGQLIYTEQYL